MSTPITLVGRIGQPPELKFGNNGKAIARFSVVTSRRVLDKATNEWSDADVTWWNCTAFGTLAENICDSLGQGVAVIVTGRAASESWNDKNSGEKRTAMKVIADEVAPSLRFATARITKTERRDGSGGGQQSSNRQNQGGWGASQSGGQGQQGGWGSAEDAPF